MRFFATLIKTGPNKALPVMLCEAVYESDNENDQLILPIYEEKFKNYRYRIVAPNFVELYNFKNKQLDHRFLVQPKFIECLRGAANLLLEFHVWIVDLNKVVSKFFINSSIYENSPTVNVVVQDVPFLNILGTGGKGLTLWSLKKDVNEKK